MLAGAAIVFFAYIGFDSVSTHAEEAKNPSRDVPIGIIVSLVLCTVLYIAVAAVLTGMVPYDQINIDAPVSDAFRQAGLPWAQLLISIGALAGITSVLLVMMLSQPRIFLAMARDGLLPPGFFGAVHRAVPHAVEVDDPDRHLRGASWRRSCRCASWPSSSTSARCSRSSSSARRCSSCGRRIRMRSGRSARRWARSCRSLGILCCLLLMFSLPAGELGAAGRLAGHRLRHLLRLRPPAQRRGEARAKRAAVQDVRALNVGAGIAGPVRPTDRACSFVSA